MSLLLNLNSSYSEIERECQYLHLESAKNVNRFYPDSLLLNRMIFFCDLFFTHGFLYTNNQPPAFADAYKNIDIETFHKIYSSIAVFYLITFWEGLEQPNKSLTILKHILIKIYTCFDPDIIQDQLINWTNTDSENLLDRIYLFFYRLKVFHNVFNTNVSDFEVRYWFKDFLGQTLKFSLSADI